MFDAVGNYIVRTAAEIGKLDGNLVLLALLAVVIFVVLEKIQSSVKRSRIESGIRPQIKEVYVEGSRSLPVRSYFSEAQGLAGRPDALLVEDGMIIPVERKPLANKIRDRYVAQLLVYMRLVEEFEGKKPPYGYLILGSNCRQVKIENSPERQAWLQGIIDEMRGIIDGAPAKAQPHPKKCRQCDVREHCASRGDRASTQEVVSIGNKSRASAR